MLFFINSFGINIKLYLKDIKPLAKPVQTAVLNIMLRIKILSESSLH